MSLGAGGCSPAVRDVAIRGPQQVEVADPAPGSLNVALLSFDLDTGVPAPKLQVASGYRLSGSEVLVAGVAPDPSLPNGYVGLVAIANFKGPGQVPQRRAGDEVSSDQEYSIEFAGDASYAADAVATYGALTSHGSWQVSRYQAPAGVPAVAADPSALLEQIVSDLRGAASPELRMSLQGRFSP